MRTKREIEDAIYEALQRYKAHGIDALDAAVKDLVVELPDGNTKGFLQRWLRHSGADPQDRHIELTYFWVGYRAAVTEQTIL